MSATYRLIHESCAGHLPLTLSLKILHRSQISAVGRNGPDLWVAKNHYQILQTALEKYSQVSTPRCTPYRYPGAFLAAKKEIE